MLQADSITSRFHIKKYEQSQFYIIDNADTPVEIIKDNNFFLSYELLDDFDLTDKFEKLQITMFEPINNIEILIIGTGKQQKFPDKCLYKELESLPYSVDFMNNAAASRTFNILVNEERKVGVLMFIE